MLADPSSGQQSQQGGGAGAYATGSDNWPFVIAYSHDGNGTQLVGLSSRWLSRLVGGGEEGTGDGVASQQSGGSGLTSPALPRQGSAAVTASSIIQCTSSSAVHVAPGVGGREAQAAGDVDALPLRALLATVDRLLPLPQLPPKKAAPSSAGGGGSGSLEARERVVAHLAAVVLLQDAAEQCRGKVELGGRQRGVTAELCREGKERKEGMIGSGGLCNEGWGMMEAGGWVG